MKSSFLLSTVGIASLSAFSWFQVATPARAEVDTSVIKPANISPEWIETHFQNDTYGFLLGKNGSILALHDSKGTVVFREIGGWGLQSTIEGLFGYGGSNDAKGRISKSKSADGATVFEIRKTRSPFFEWTQTITCMPKKLIVEQNLEFIQTPPSGPDTNIIIPSGPESVNFRPNFKPIPATNPTVYEFKDGTRVEAKYDDKFRWFAAPGFTGSAFYLDFKGKKEKGGKDSIKVTYSFR